MIQEWSCIECHAVLFDEHGAPRSPCPRCGSTKRAAPENVEERFVLYDEMRMKGKHTGKGEPFFEARSGASFYRKTEQWHHVEQIVDRDNKRYIKIIKDIKMGEVIRHDDKPLSQHTGHGSAKKRGS